MIVLPVDNFLPHSILVGIKQQISSLTSKGAKIRMIQVSYEDFHSLLKKFQYPFSPTILGVPVEPAAIDEIAVIAVRDDDTNTSTNSKGKSEEIWRQ